MNSRRIIIAVAVACTLNLAATVVLAQERVVIAPSVWFLKTVAKDPPDWLQRGIVSPSGFAGTIRFARELNQEEISQFELDGLTFGRRFKRLASWDVDHLGAIYPVWISWEGFEIVQRHPLTFQIESEEVLPPMTPLNVTKPQTGAPELTNQLAVQMDLKPGQGIKLADIDSGIDVFHPAFFHADGGYYRWIDMDGNGALTLGVDACDLNRDGQGSPDEILQWHDVTLMDAYNATSMKFLDPDGIFEQDVDWIYVDVNGNGERDFGPEDGFGENAPAFGEPVVLVDDVNRNLALDPEEKLVMLKTSKVKKALVMSQEYVAGENLSQLTSDKFPADNYSATPASMHGTGVAGILAANTPGLSRFVGVAPYLELYMIDSTKEGYFSPGGIDGSLPKLLWARDQEVDILLFEVASYGLTFMDGTSNLENGMDQLFEKNGIIQVVPAGNLADSGKHMYTQLPPGDSLLTLNVPKLHPAIEFYPYETPVYIFSTFWKGKEGDVEFELAAPETDQFVSIPAMTNDAVAVGSNTQVFCYSGTSVSGFVHRMCYVMDIKQKAVQAGDWQWRFKNKTGNKLPLHGFVSDPASSWDRTIEYDKWEATDGTICHPSTANSALSVAAYGGEFGPPEDLGMIRAYSSRGPRMDGFPVIDIAAPDDPYTPLARMKTGLMMGNRDIIGGYTIFGGTSGAGPHVAGTLAILKQLNPSASPQILFEAVTLGAAVEAHMGQLPNKEWGFGRLNIYQSHFGHLPPLNEPPVAGLTVMRRGLSVDLDASPSGDPEKGLLEYQWDFDYDGEFDTGWLESPKLAYDYPAAGSYVVKLAVRDGGGAVAFTLGAFSLEEGVEDQPPVIPVDDAPESDATDSSPPILVEDDEGGGGGAGGGCTAASTSTQASAILLLLVFALLALGVGRAYRVRNR